MDLPGQDQRGNCRYFWHQPANSPEAPGTFIGQDGGRKPLSIDHPNCGTSHITPAMPHFTRSNGVSLHYETSGTGPLDLLFLHGWGGSARFWDPFIAQHANFPGSRRVCLSFRGHGDSEKPQEGYSVSELAREGLDVLDAIGSVRAVVIGFSMGGKIAPYCGMMDPRRIVGQVLVAPAGPARIEIPREMIEEYLEAASDPQQIRKLFRPWMKEEPEERVYDRFIEDLNHIPTNHAGRRNASRGWRGVDAGSRHFPTGVPGQAAPGVNWPGAAHCRWRSIWPGQPPVA
jgi:pimeloyl-ACP methyl ester carboxylesterase